LCGDIGLLTDAIEEHIVTDCIPPDIEFGIDKPPTRV